MKAHLRKLNSRLAKGKAKTYTIELLKGTDIGGALDVGEEGKAKITYSPPSRLRSSCSCTNFTET